MTSVPVYLEETRRRTFAAALDWPGWCRSGKTAEAALEALAAYVPRFAVVVQEAGLAWPVTPEPRFDVVERVPGGSTTEFGAPQAVLDADTRAVSPQEAQRDAALLAASWVLLDRVAASAPPVLRKGPRGGGRDTDAIVEHVVEAERSYARLIGVRHRPFDVADRSALEALRADVLEVLRRPSDGAPPRPNGWPPRYAVRRMAWHVLDHVWEIEDKSSPQPD